MKFVLTSDALKIEPNPVVKTLLGLVRFLMHQTLFSTTFLKWQKACLSKQADVNSRNFSFYTSIPLFPHLEMKLCKV